MPDRPGGPKPGASLAAEPGDKPGATREQIERRERFQRAQRDSLRPPEDVTVLYGWHPVHARALQNPARRMRKLLATENAARRLADEKIPTSTAAGDRAARRDRGAARARRRASGPLSRGRSAALAADRGTRDRRPRAGARPDHRSAQCRRDLPLGGGICRRPPSSPPRGTARRPPACWRKPPPARSNTCRSSWCRTWRAGSRRSKERGFLVIGLDSTRRRRSRRDCRCGAARARARRRRQGPAATDQGNLRPRRPARPARRDPEPQRVERRGGCALCRGEPAQDGLSFSSRCRSR